MNEGDILNNKLPSILVVDDTPANLKLISGMLREKGYKVRPATSGKLALRAAENDPPDIILLDINMPHMNGFEVCTRLKRIDKLKDIPVIFISALTETLDKVKAFGCGGVDYITKPFQFEEVHARVETHLKLRHYQIILERQNKELREAARLREVVERITQHDLKQPISCIIGYPKMILKIGGMNNEQTEMLQSIEKSGYRMLNMINRSLDLYKMEKGTYRFFPERVNLLEILSALVTELQNLARARGVTIQIFLCGAAPDPEDQFLIIGDPLLCHSMMGNLLQNALEASPQNEIVTISLEQNETALVRIHNQGAVPEKIRQSFFDKFSTAGKRDGTGLGTYSAKLCAETQNGRIEMQTSHENGTTVTVRLPINS